MTSENTKRIAKNTAMLYIRMLFTMFVSLYTSRIVLNVLGVEEYGIYNVVGGVIVMFSFINVSMSSATSRFLTFELGKNSEKKLNQIFSGAMTIHIFIAILILILGETVGLWFLQNKLVIPEGRKFTALVVYQLSIISTIVNITQVPYNAAIIAHERMHVYAYIEILNTLLKLLIVYLLVWLGGDKLILYGILTLIVASLITLIYRIYCLRYFPECRYRFMWDKSLLIPMLSFSGWDLYGNMSVVGRTQGVNMLLNIFFGTVLNAANGVANQVQAAVMSFSGNVLTAVRPQIVKNYATGNISYMVMLINNTAKFTFLLLWGISLPLLLETHFVLKLWLKTVPDYTVIFCQLTLVFNFFANWSSVVVTGLHAIGKIKRPSLINGSLYLLVIPVSYIIFKYGGKPDIPFWCNVFFVFVGCALNVWALKIYLPQFSVRDFATNVFGVCSIITFLSIIPPFIVQKILEESIWRFLAVGITAVGSVAALTYFVGLDRNSRLMVKNKVLNLYAKVWK